MKKVEITEAYIIFKVECTCPHCKKDVDIVESVTGDGRDPFEDHVEDEIVLARCPECKKSFNVKFEY